jgi:hypothetical protein
LRVTALNPEYTEHSNAAGQPRPLLFWLFLLFIAIVGLVIRLDVGRRTFISFDEWQHVFMASGARWADLSFELRTNAHPPLFFLLLRGIARLGGVAHYRAISIGAGVGSIVVVGLVARRLLDSPVMQLACTAAFALSTDAISISVEIRSYQLAVFLALVAFWAWLAMFPGADGKVNTGPCVVFAIFSVLAVSSHYSVVFFLGACLTVPILLASLSPSLRQCWIARKHRKSAWLFASAMAFPCAVFAIYYIVHVRAQLMQGYDPEFYRGGIPNEAATSFLLRNSRNFFNLFSPLELNSATAVFVVVALLCFAAIWVVFRLLRTPSADGGTKAAAILFAGVIVLELLAASLAREYPFGGLLRHQYIAGPFLLMAAFVMADTFTSVGSPALRIAMPALLLTGCVANLIIEGPKLVLYPGQVLLNDEFIAWRAAFPDTHAVYLDHWGVIGHFIHTNDHRRVFVRRLADDALIDQYHISDGTPEGTEIFYDKTRDVLDLSDASVYRSFAACLRGAGVGELTLFFFSPGNRPFDRMPDDLKTLIVQKAAEQGLAAINVTVSRTSVFAGFALR